VETILSTGNDKLVLLHTVSNYPIKELSEVNLNAMVTMRKALNVLTGYSDHTTTLSTPTAAAALGMAVYERHFTLDKNIPAPDCALSADPKEMKEIVKSIREVEKALGSGRKNPANSEKNMRLYTRKSIIARSKINKGEKVSADKVIIKRPASGIEPKHMNLVIGREARVDIKEDEAITWDKV